LKIAWNEFGEYQPAEGEGHCDRCGICLKVCPFFGDQDDETTLAHGLFAPEPGMQNYSPLGYFLGCYVGYSRQEGHRAEASSGGLLRWTLEALLKSGRATPQGQRLRKAAELAEILAQVTGLPVVLVPHVTSLSQNPEGCDYLFLKSLDPFLNDPSRYRLLPDHLNAQETMWVISQCQLFVGARTHATIAAFSSGVPTLSIAYSPKAIGLNQDIFSHADFCISTTDLDPQAFREKITELVRSADAVRKHLGEQIPKLKSQAWAAGDILRNGIS